VWPPAEAKDQSLYFQPGKQLSWIKPATTAAASTYVSDPAHPVPYADGIHMGRTREYMTDDQRFASRRPDVLTFETPVLTEDLTVTGTVIADLKVTLSTTDADFVVKIIDVYPDDYKDSELRYPLGGAQMLVRGEIMRGKFRNSFEKPEPFKPGKVETVKFELPDISHCFKKGHKLMIQVQSSWFPLADRNPQQFMNIYQAEDKDFVPATIQLHHDAKNSSAIILPVLSGR
jgi:putative CocE/NonD family hydrolase